MSAFIRCVLSRAPFPHISVKERSRLKSLIAATSFTTLCCIPAYADDWTTNIGPLSFDYGVSAAGGAFAVPQANFGAGSYNYRSSLNYLSGGASRPPSKILDPAWLEADVAPEIRTTVKLNGTTTLNTDVSAVFAQTFGSGDASLLSTTAGNPGSLALEQAWVSLKTGVPFGLKGDSTVIKLGPQDFFIDDAFLVGLGTKDLGDRAAYYLGPKIAFTGPGTVNLNYDPVRADFFALGVRSDQRATFGADQPHTNFAGFDVTLFKNAATPGADGALNYGDRASYATFTYMNLYDADTNPANGFGNPDISDARRQGLNVLSLSVGGNVLPFAFLNLHDNASIYGQFVKEYNSGTDRYGNSKNVNALAYYIEPGYTFNALSWAPHVYYRFSYFSGQKNSDAASTKTSYDPLFYYSFIRSEFGSWYMGEITGNYVVGNSNIQVNQIGASVTPPIHLFTKTDSLKLDLIAYDFDMVNPQQYGASTKKLDDEVDLAAEYTINPLTYVNGAIGIAVPGKGGREMAAATASSLGSTNGIKSSTYVIEAYLVRNF